MDRVIVIYTFQKHEREAFQLVLSLLKNPTTKITIIMPSRESWERHLCEETDDDSLGRGTDDELDELIDYSPSHDSDYCSRHNSQGSPEQPSENLSASQATLSEFDEELQEAKSSQKKHRYEFADFFDIIFLLGLAKKGLLHLANILWRLLTTDESRRQTEEPRSGDSSTEMASLPNLSSPSNTVESIELNNLSTLSSSSSPTSGIPLPSSSSPDQKPKRVLSDADAYASAPVGGLKASRSFFGLNQ